MAIQADDSPPGAALQFGGYYTLSAASFQNAAAQPNTGPAQSARSRASQPFSQYLRLGQRRQVRTGCSPSAPSTRASTGTTRTSTGAATTTATTRAFCHRLQKIHAYFIHS